MCPKDEWILEALETQRECRSFVNKLSDEEFVNLHLSEKIKSCELSIKALKDELSYLKKAHKKFTGVTISVPTDFKSYIMDAIREGMYRFRGNRDKQDELYSSED